MDRLYKAGLTGRGETIAIVDAFGSPTIQSDLATFDQQTGLPAPPSFQIIQPDGQVPPYNPNTPDMTGWAEETSLDVEYAHTMAPGANILLVETPVDETKGVQGFPQIVQAENYVIDHDLGDVISQSFGATEETFPNAQSIMALRSAYVNAARHQVTVLGASGDAGATDDESDLIDFYPFRVDSWPSTDPLVTSVGGTQLHLDQNGNRTAPDNVWNDSDAARKPRGRWRRGLVGVHAAAVPGRGCARCRLVPRHARCQHERRGQRRGERLHELAGLPGPGWYIIGGTSEATPLFSGIVAVADQAAHHRLGLLNPTLYGLRGGRGSGIVDITNGNNTVTFTEQDPSAPDYGNTYTVQGFDAVPGYDLASGLGTADGARLVFRLAFRGGER